MGGRQLCQRAAFAFSAEFRLVRLNAQHLDV
jgi:hypothetical protein